MASAIMEEHLAPRLSIVARHPAEFMRYAARAASLSAIEVMQVSDEVHRVQLLFVCAFILALIWRRSRRSDVAQALLRSLLVAVFFHIRVQIALMPRVIELEPTVPRYRDIDSLTASWCYHNCRFRKEQLPRVLAVMRLPEVCRLENGASVPVETVLICSLYTLSYPRKQEDTANLFGFTNQTLVSRILKFFSSHLVFTFGHLLQPADDDDDGFMIWAPYMRMFQDAIFAVSEFEQLNHVAFFTDGTFRPSCRPRLRQDDADRDLSTQRRVYSGLRHWWISWFLTFCNRL